jgi:rare lipoprotein A
MRVRMGDDDLVRSAPRTSLSVARKVRVLKVKRVAASVMVSVPFPTVVHYTDDLTVGQSVVNRSGAAGLSRQTVVSTYLNGRLISKKIVASQVISAPVEQIVLKGRSKSSGGSRDGIASWYGCSGMHAASPWLPFGTVVRVTNLANGRSVSVVINDRGPYGPGRIIDLCSPAFSAIAPLDQGLAKVRITW